MPERFEQALASTGAELARSGSDTDRAQHGRVAAMGATVAAWCEQLGASRVPASLDHNDLHPWNILGTGPGPTRFYDWGDSVVAHPFAAMLVPLGMLRRLLDVPLDDPRFLRARDAYLDGFAPLAPGKDLAGTLAVACRVAKIARVLTWDRALEASRAQGEAIPDSWATAPLETLVSLLDDAYVGGA
ncbi:MAG: phosphotransferase [Acidimicrobiia bacterium]